MANLKASPGDTDTGRAQMFLIAALVLATVFVVLALFLNSAIYTENFATRGQATIDSGEAATFSDDLERNLGLLMTELNDDRDIDDFNDLDSYFEGNATSLENGTFLHHQQRGISLDVEVVQTTEGTRVVQDNVGEFTDPDDDGTWEVIDDLSVRAFDLTITSASTNPFEIDIEDDDGDIWAIEITDGGGTDIAVELDGETCTTEEPVSINITSATVGNSPCPALEPLLSIPHPVAIEFVNGDRVDGTYELTVDAPKQDFDGASQPTEIQHRDEGDQPWAIEAIYDVEVEFAYHSAGITYEGTLRVAPGEPRG